MTKTQEIVNNGYKDNSMYEDHSVIGQATVEDMNIYYTKETNKIINGLPQMLWKCKNLLR